MKQALRNAKKIKTGALWALVAVALALVLRATFSWAPQSDLDTRFKAAPPAPGAIPAPANPDKLKSLPGPASPG